MSVYLNTYKVTVETTVQAASEEEARSAVTNLLNNSGTIGGVNSFTLQQPQGSGETRVSGINNVEIKLQDENQQGKAQNNKQKKLQKLAEEEIKKMEERQGGELRQIPDEIVVIDPDTGSGVVVPTPNKAKLQEEQQKKLEKEQESDLNPQTGETNKESQKQTLKEKENKKS